MPWRVPSTSSWPTSVSSCSSTWRLGWRRGCAPAASWCSRDSSSTRPTRWATPSRGGWRWRGRRRTGGWRWCCGSPDRSATVVEAPVPGDDLEHLVHGDGPVHVRVGLAGPALLPAEVVGERRGVEAQEDELLDPAEVPLDRAPQLVLGAAVHKALGGEARGRDDAAG